MLTLFLAVTLVPAARQAPRPPACMLAERPDSVRVIRVASGTTAPARCDTCTVNCECGCQQGGKCSCCASQVAQPAQAQPAIRYYQPAPIPYYQPAYQPSYSFGGFSGGFGGGCAGGG